MLEVQPEFVFPFSNRLPLPTTDNLSTLVIRVHRLGFADEFPTPLPRVDHAYLPVMRRRGPGWEPLLRFLRGFARDADFGAHGNEPEECTGSRISSLI
jgi:hypothetical protein